MIKLKGKLILGIGFLFCLILLTGIIASFYLNRISHASANILKDNYESLQFMHALQAGKNRIESGAVQGWQEFDQTLRLQEANITEPGEWASTRSIRNMVEALRKEDSIPAKDSRELDSLIQDVIRLNMLAIEKKNEMARRTSEEAISIIAVASAVMFVVGLSFAYSFPSLITDPLEKFTEAVQAISGKQYGYRIHLDRKDELGQLATAFNRMAEKLDEYEHSNLAKLIFEKERAEAVINSFKDASIGIGADGKILFVNKEARHLLHLEGHDATGKPVAEVMANNDLLRYLVNGQDRSPVKIVVGSQEQFFSIEEIEIGDDSGKIAKMIVLKNITPFRELDVAKTNFIATISHELKTPLASIDLSLKLLADNRTGSLNEEQIDLVDSIKEDKNRLVRIVSELLDLSQVETGNIRINLEPVLVNTICEKAIGTVQNAAREKQIAIHYNNSGIKAVARLDEEKTVWVLVNLLTNAIRYSPPGSTVNVEENVSGDRMIISVTDEGIGIEIEYRQKIFDRYFRVPGHGPSTGTGLGLAISKEFMEAQGCEISVESEVGKGSKFSLILPIQPAA
ncbi:ATP-binding protein [Flavihumibacter rivuli]|uniref:sensor histidine kinase n=1 Tax=Flavihumibacter rivuli TaxID=2838156 RepID=UPI001BDF2BDA|nr:ATP-binding protein [Flavihumibacter rivuli]ULQ55094.1 ATP-binding protein [Flavihumibacter rivuli]